VESIAIFNILAITGALGADTGLVWAISRSMARRRAADVRRFIAVAVVPVAVVGVGIAVAMWVWAGELATLFGGDDHRDSIASTLRIFTVVVPVASLYHVLLGGTRGFSTMVPTVMVDRFARPLVQPVAVGLILAIGGSATSLALGWAGPFVFGLAAAVALLSRLVRRRVTGPGVGRSEPARPLRVLATRFWRFTLPRSVASIFRVGVQWIDVLLVGAIMSPADAALYGYGTRLLQFGLFVAVSVGQVAQPMFGGLLAAQQRDRARSVYQTATGWQVAITWPQYIVAAFFGALLLRTLFGGAYVEAAPVVAILALSTMVGAAAGPVDMLLLMAGKSTWSLWNTGATLATNVGLNIVLIPRYGIVGAAISWSISRLLANALPLFQVARHVGLHPFGRGVGLASTGSAGIFGALGLAAWFVDDKSGWVFLAYVVVASTGYVLFLRRYREELDLSHAWQAFRRRRKRVRVPSTYT
jgi:O-antigen/teichoic acid export membrane protein